MSTVFFQNTGTATPPRSYFEPGRLPVNHTVASESSSLDVLYVSISRLLALLQEYGKDDYGEIGPSQPAFNNAVQLVVKAALIMGKDVPSSPVVDSQGGIRITWRRDGRQVKLVCPAGEDAPVYIYEDSDGDHSVRNWDITPEVLADRLTWLINSEPTVSERVAG